MAATAPRSRRRSLARAGVVMALCLAFGAVVNFGVAWWCVLEYEADERALGNRVRAALRSGSRFPLRPKPPSFAIPVGEWCVEVPDTWALTPEFAKITELGWMARREEWAQKTAIDDRGRTGAARWDTGWPLRCWWRARLWSEYSLPLGDDIHVLPVPPHWRPLLGVDELPIGIHPLPFIANTLIYAAIPMGLWFAIGPLRRWRRRRAGRCTRCGYDRAGLAAGMVCPECGAASA